MPPQPSTVLSAGCKANLYLRILKRRLDGYHELHSLFVPLSYPRDRLHVGPASGEGLILTCSLPELAGRDNTLHAAYEAYAQSTGWAPGLKVRLEKRIPRGAGLGGGSSDAAVFLAYLHELCPRDKRLSSEMLHRIAARVGADVPFFLVGGPALATGVGDHLQPVAGLPHRWVILLTFPFAVPTAEVYKNLNLALTNCSKVTKSFTLTDGRMTGGFPRLCNDLETVTAVRYPEIDRAKAHLLEEGAENALMSGSGPTVFGLFRNEARARQAQEALWGLEDWGVLSAELRV